MEIKRGHILTALGIATIAGLILTWRSGKLDKVLKFSAKDSKKDDRVDTEHIKIDEVTREKLENVLSMPSGRMGEFITHAEAYFDGDDIIIKKRYGSFKQYCKLIDGDYDGNICNSPKKELGVKRTAIGWESAFVKKGKSTIHKYSAEKPDADTGIRDMFFSKQYKGRVPDEDIQHILESERWAKFYGKEAVKKAWGEFVDEEYVVKEGDEWVWPGYFYSSGRDKAKRYSATSMNDSDKQTIKMLMKTHDFLGLREPLESKEFTVDFSTSPFPVYIIQKNGGKVAITNKKHADDYEFEHNDIVMGELT